MTPTHSPARVGLLALAAVAATLTTVSAQFTFDPNAGGFEFEDPAGGDQFSTEPVGGELVTLSAEFSPAADGQPAMIAVTADIQDGYHIYSITQAKGGPQPTDLRLDGSSGVKLAGPWVADPAPKTHIDEEIWVGLKIEEHYGRVTWRAPITLPDGVDPTTLQVQGTANLQACTETTCHNLENVGFTATSVAPGTIPPIEESTAASTETAGPAPAETATLTDLAPILVGAFLGGLILNLMPCVLPVIGLKVLSFAEQAGHDRGKVLAMNLAYTAGLMSVFMLLAGLAAFAGYAWGELYTHAEFKIGMVVLVFAMALSFLGVWEIPLPGFAGGKNANELQHQEGYAGAFFKGVFTTILATPCSGPYLGAVFGYTLTVPPWVTFLLFGMVGFGMASPYLMIGAFPSLVKALPKPGAWMETFKQLMGFVLMGTAVYLFSLVSEEHKLPVLATLVAIAFGCWWVGTTPITAGTQKRVTAWLGGFLASVAVGYWAFTQLGPSEHELEWVSFSPATLEAAKAEGKTVLVDFTADWCRTCQNNSHYAINTERVKEVVEANDVTPLLADWSDRSESIKRTLESLGSRSIPFLAIFPADRPEDPILLPDLITESQLLAALAEAGAVEGNEADVKVPAIEIGEAATPTFR